MPFDFKKEYREFYLPKGKPEIVTVPPANFIAYRGAGDPNEEGGAYQAAVGVEYAIAYTLKMSPRAGHEIAGFFDYVVPPLEGLWWQEGTFGVDMADKSSFNWVSLIRLPDFVTREEFEWARETAARKKKLDCSGAEFLTVDEGPCVQAMHIGPYDTESQTVALMDCFIAEQGYVNDFSDTRFHHEIYLSDPRKAAPEKMKTVVRHPVRRA